MMRAAAKAAEDGELPLQPYDPFGSFSWTESAGSLR